MTDRPETDQPATDHATLVRRSLAAETAEEFDRRVASQADRLAEAIEAGAFDNDAFTVGLELEAYAVTGVDGTAGDATEADDSLHLAELPEDVFDGPAAKELGLHNAELNAEPTALDEAGIARQADELAENLAETRERAREHGLELVLDAMWAVPPRQGTSAYLNDVTVDGRPDESEGRAADGTAAADAARDGDGALVPGPEPDDPVVLARNMRADPRYAALDNEALRRAEGVLPFEVPGASLRFRSILFESLATSIQPHVQVPDVDAFPRYHNLAVRTLGPLLALSTNSPFLPADCYRGIEAGTDPDADAVTDADARADPARIVAETHHELRIAAFEQSMNQGCRKVRVPDDLDSPTDAVAHVVADDTYAPFLREWLDDEADAEPKDGEADAEPEDGEADAEPEDDEATEAPVADDDLTDRGTPGGDPVRVDDCWEFDYKRGTFWRWVRGVACGDPVDGACDERSLRIEYRPLPTQPTVRDTVGLQVLTAGLLRGLVAADHPLETLSWDAAEASFYAAVEDGIDADLAWIAADGERTDDPAEIFEEVFTFARRGLDEQGVPASVQNRYLGPIEARWERGVAPSGWKKARVHDALADGATFAEALESMQREYVRLSRETDSFAEWI